MIRGNTAFKQQLSSFLTQMKYWRSKLKKHRLRLIIKHIHSTTKTFSFSLFTFLINKQQPESSHSFYFICYFIITQLKTLSYFVVCQFNVCKHFKYCYYHIIYISFLSFIFHLSFLNAHIIMKSFVLLFTRVTKKTINREIWRSLVTSAKYLQIYS